jgi:predicted nucleic acid-binding protein
LSRISLDTGVIIEYIDLVGKFHRQAEALIENISKAKLFAVIPHSTLVETYYVSARIYEKLGVERPYWRAEELAKWLYRSPNFNLAEPSLELAIQAGNIKGHFNLALTDAYVIAASKLIGGRAVFRKREREMVERLNELTKSYNIIFLEDYDRTTESTSDEE